MTEQWVVTFQCYRHPPAWPWRALPAPARPAARRYRLFTLSRYQVSDGVSAVEALSTVSMVNALAQIRRHQSRTGFHRCNTEYLLTCIQPDDEDEPSLPEYQPVTRPAGPTTEGTTADD